VSVAPLLLGSVTEAVEVDFLERPLQRSSARAAGDGFTVTVPAFGVTAVKARLSRDRKGSRATGKTAR